MGWGIEYLRSNIVVAHGRTAARQPGMKSDKQGTTAERVTNMKRAHLIAGLVGLMALGIFTTDASAMYSAAVGRFLQRDPVPSDGIPPRVGAAGPAAAGQFVPQDQYRDGMNLCQYVKSSPLSHIDPYGLWGVDIHQVATTRWAVAARGYDPKRKCKTLFTGGQAAAIGAADEAIDHGATAPARDTTWHFRPGSLAHERTALAAAFADANSNRCDSAITHLGNSLHPLQDSFSHSAAHRAATPAAHVRTSALAALPFSRVRNPDDATAWAADIPGVRAATDAVLIQFLSLPCNLCVECEKKKK